MGISTLKKRLHIWWCTAPTLIYRWGTSMTIPCEDSISAIKWWHYFSALVLSLLMNELQTAQHVPFATCRGIPYLQQQGVKKGFSPFFSFLQSTGKQCSLKKTNKKKKKVTNYKTQAGLQWWELLRKCCSWTSGIFCYFTAIFFIIIFF